MHSPLLGINWWPLQPGSHHGTKGMGHEVAWTAAALSEGGNRAGTWWRWLRWLRAPAREVHGRNSNLAEFCEIGVATGGLYSLEVTTAL